MSRRPENDYFSIGFRHFLEAIRTYQAVTEVDFPRNYFLSRISPREKISDWFRRIVDDQLEGEVKPCVVEQNMGVFCRVIYKGDLITYANIQVIIADDDLENFYFDPKIKCNYLRLDCDPNRLGEIFTHPLPHIHISESGSPRFGTDIFKSGNIVLDFFDFIYRNFYPNLWIEWAYRAYQEGKRRRADNSPDIFKPIAHAFKTNQLGILTTRYSQGLREIRNSCRSLKDSLFTKSINHQDASIILY